MQSMAERLSALALLTLLCAPVSAEDTAFAGRWWLELAPDLVGVLELREAGGQIVGYVEGGPIDVEITGDRIVMLVDSRDVSMRQFNRRLTGKLTDGVMAGTFTTDQVEGAPAQPVPWRATRGGGVVATAGQAPTPVNFEGVWGRPAGKDLRKYRMDTTPLAEEYVANYNPDLDQPPMRCMLPGLVAQFGYPYFLEIMQRPERILFFSEAFGEVRQIYLDGRSPPEFFPNSADGFSTGHFEGETLVVETTHLKAGIRDYRGEPVSENARITERYTLLDDGQTLYGEMTIDDPENYRQPPLRRTARKRSTESILLPYECDPDSFFRQLYREGTFDEYLKRGRWRR
ncbi:MAG: hypothetical protein H6978_07390 [Gammaproteobacteria bacterium]|nr:hypothetical protein [Gammaproteobacteria bacterium]